MEHLELRNDLCFNYVIWQSLEKLLIKIAVNCHGVELANSLPGERKSYADKYYRKFKAGCK